ncbi:MAG: tripartite tricarboxylate transporter TctB family protein [Rhodospirillales bacterium]|nr:tripartite tricarboxylate transporter TctB family protein [Rhodospirillales bacterium]
MSRIKGDAWAALFLLAACAVFINDLLLTENSGAFVKTTTLPIALAVVLALLSLMLLGWTIWYQVRRPMGLNASPQPRERAAHLRVFLLVALTAIYISALPWFGFMISTAVLIAGASMLYGNKNPFQIIGAMALIPTALLLFFEQYMVVLLPSARLFE